MPHSRSSRKRVRQSRKHQVQNQSLRSAVKSQEKKLLALIAAGKVEEAQRELPITYKRLDKIAKVHVWHRNRAANHKRKLAKKVHALAAKKAGT
jgi:small subunit ribosomal protein S20